MITKIYIDLDQTAADWINGFALKHFPQYLNNIDGFNKMKDRNNLIRQAYFKDLYTFRTLPVMPEFIELYKNLMLLDIDLIWLSTIDPNHPFPQTVLQNKKEWITRNIDVPLSIKSVDNSIFVFKNEHKSRFANKESLLLDDYDKNCKDFIEAGGSAYQIENLDPNWDFTSICQLIKNLG